MTLPAKRGLTGAPSPRQLEVLALVGEGLSNPEIALRLGIGERTVRTQVDKLRAKLGADNKRALIPLAREHGKEESG